MDVNVIVSLIGSVGFPIAITAYVLTTLKKTMDENTRSNQAMTVLLTRICTKLDIDT